MLDCRLTLLNFGKYPSMAFCWECVAKPECRGCYGSGLLPSGYQLLIWILKSHVCIQPVKMTIHILTTPVAYCAINMFPCVLRWNTHKQTRLRQLSMPQWIGGLNMHWIFLFCGIRSNWTTKCKNLWCYVFSILPFQNVLGTVVLDKETVNITDTFFPGWE